MFSASALWAPVVLFWGICADAFAVCVVPVDRRRWRARERERERENNKSLTRPQYREARLREMMDVCVSMSHPCNFAFLTPPSRQRAQYGAYEEIGGSDAFVRDVTELSERGEKGVWVVCALYAPGSAACDRVHRALGELAPRFATTRFVKCRGSVAIRDYPDHACPTILVYHKGDVKRQWVGLDELHGSTMSTADLEWALNTLGAVEGSALEDDPRYDDARAAERGRRLRGHINSGVGSRQTNADLEARREQDLDDDW